MSCCTPDGSCSTSTSDRADVGDGHVTAYRVSGMTCGHCETAVTKALDEVESVLAVNVQLSTGRVTVTTGGEPDDTLIAKAVDEAGYELVGRA